MEAEFEMGLEGVGYQKDSKHQKSDNFWIKTNKKDQTKYCIFVGMDNVLETSAKQTGG